MELKYIIKRPIISEKSLLLANGGKFTFEIDPAATKLHVKQAITQFFGVSPVDVKTVVIRGKKRRVTGKRITFMSSDKKKAIITLPKGKSIPQFVSWFSLESIKETAAVATKESKAEKKTTTKAKPQTKEAGKKPGASTKVQQRRTQSTQTKKGTS